VNEINRSKNKSKSANGKNSSESYNNNGNTFHDLKDEEKKVLLEILKKEL